METHTCKKGTALSTSAATGTPALKNFTIPRKKRGDGKDLLEPCPKDSREYSLIQKALSDSRLDPGKEIFGDTWQCEDIKLIDSEELRREFTEKRAEMRSKDRHTREMAERFCFFVTSDEKATKIYQQGLITRETDQHCLGNPSYGVYLHRHADVALKSASAGKILIIFKVLFGKMKKVRMCSTHDPVVKYDCHVSRDPCGPRDSLSQQVTGSSVFLFDYNDKQELTTRPRQCLPYAMVSLAPAVNSTLSTPTSVAVPSLKLRPMDLVTNLKTCTVAERWGRGQNATVKFKHFGASESPMTGYKSQGLEKADQPIAHGTSSKDPDRSHQNGNDPLLTSFDLRTPQPQFCASVKVTPPAIPFLEKNGPFPHSQFPSHAGLTQMDQNSLQSSHHIQSFQQAQSTPCMNQNNQWQQSDIPPTAVLEKVTSVVTSSRVIKDPRMLRRSTSTLQRSNSVDSEGGQQTEANAYVNESMENAEHKNIPYLPNQENKIVAKETENDAKRYLTERSCASASLENNSVASSSVRKSQTEKQPSYRMLKIKFKKYSAYLQLSKEERKAKIWSLENVSLDERKLLLERINFYDNFFQKYKKGQLIRNDKETTVNPEPSCKRGSKHVYLSTDTGESSSQKTRKSKNADVQRHVRSGNLPLFSIPEPPFHICDVHLDLTPSLETNTEHTFRLEKTDKGSVAIDRDPETQTSTQSTSHNSIQIKGKEDQEDQADGLGAMKYCAQSESVITLPSIDTEATTASGETVNVDPQTIQPEAVSHMVTGDKQVISLLASVIEEQFPDPFTVNSGGIMQNTEEKSEHELATEEQTQDTASWGGSKQETEERSDLHLMMVEKPEDALHSGDDTMATETSLEPTFYSHTDIIGACVEVRAMETSEDAVTTVCPLGLSSENNERDMESSGSSHDQDTGAIHDGKGNTQECVKDAIYSFLHNRFELSQLFLSPVQNGSFSISRKHYLKPKCINSPMDTCTTPPPNCNPNQLIRGVRCDLCITIKADREYCSGTESTSLAKIFPGPEFSKLTSLTEQRQGNNSNTTGKTPIGDALKATATYKDEKHRANSHNLKLIKIMAEKYNGKENTSFNKLRKHQLKKSSVVEKVTSETAQLDSSRKRQRTFKSHVPFMLREKRWCDVTNKNSELDTLFSTELRRSTRNRNVQNNTPAKHLTMRQSTSAAHKSSSRTTKQVPMKPKKGIIIKMMKDFRRGNSWWTYSHKFNTNRMHHQSKLCDDPVFSNKEREILTVSDEVLNTNNPAREQHNTLKRTQDSPEHTLPAMECIDMAVSSHENGSTTDGNKPEDQPLEEVLQAGKLFINESSDPPNTQIQSEDVISVSEIMEYPLDAAIEMFCGSEAERETNTCTPKARDEIAGDLPHTKSYDEDEMDVTCDGPDQFSTTPKEIRLISRLRNFLTRFESTVQRAETKTSDSDSEDENALQICDTSQSTAADPVPLVVLDRVELPHLRQCTYEPVPHSTDKSQDLNITEIQQDAGKGDQSEMTSQHTKADISQVDTTNQEQGEKTKMDHTNLDSIPCISPDSTSTLEVLKGFTQGHVDNNETNSGISTCVPATGWFLNKENVERHISTDQQYNSSSTLDSNNMIKLRPRFEPTHSEAGQMMENDHGSHNVSVNALTFQRHFSVVDISLMLQEGDTAASLVQLVPLRSHCKVMLQYFILNFEKKQNVEAKQIVITRDLVLEQYLERPPVPIELKYEALNSFLEMQMMMEAWQFIDNKMRYLSGQSTFRSLLWYDPTLYGELFKGKVGFQQQTSLYSSFQKSLTASGTSALQKYHLAVSSLNQQLQRSPNTSYYMYLKCKRERLEVEAALRNPLDIESFYLSVPLSCMINFGDSVESLEKTKNLVTIFTEIPADRLEGGFDIGKAEQLAMMCRYLQEKIFYLRACTNTMLSKISWIGMEHLLYDASKLMVCRDGKRGTSHELLMKYSKSNPNIIYGKTESGESLSNSRWPRKTPLTASLALARHQRRVNGKVYQGRGRGRSTEKNNCAQNKVPKDGPITTIDLTRETSPSPPDDGSNKSPQSVCHQARLPNNPAIYLLPGKQQENVDRSHDIHGMKSNIPAPFLPQVAQPYPEIMACLLTKGVTAPNSLMQLPAPLGVGGVKLCVQWSQSWPPNNRTTGDVRQMQLPWSSLPSSLLLPPHMPPAGSAAQQPPPTSSTDHIPPMREQPPINYPFFLLNGQTYAAVNSAPPSATHHTGVRFPPHHT